MRLLDLFCGAGGAAVGYHQAGFDEIVGVDIEPQPNYPFTFIRDDALQLAAVPEVVDRFDLIHASPPCQHFTEYRKSIKDITERYEDLIEPTRAVLEESGLPYVIENVPRAPIRPDLVLCGSMFGLDVRRHRWFELGWWDALAPGGCNHLSDPKVKSIKKGSKRTFLEIGSWGDPLPMQKAAMGVDWGMTVRELSEAIPPAYTKFIGEAFIAQAVAA